MDESNDRCNWKKVFKKFLEPQKPVENVNKTQNSLDESVTVGSNLNQEKKISEPTLIPCSISSDDSGYDDYKLEFFNKLHSETHNTLEQNLDFPLTGYYKAEFHKEFNFESHSSDCDELNMNISKTCRSKSGFYDKLSSNKFPPYEYYMNTPEVSGCKQEYNYSLSSKIPSPELNMNPPQAVPENNTSDNIQSTLVPEWNKAFKSILRDNSSVKDVPYQKDIIYPSKETGSFGNSETSGITSKKKQSTYKPKRRYEKAKRYEDPEVDEAEKKVKEIFALSRMFKFEQVNMNDFHGCGVDIFKQDWSSSTKPTNRSIDKPYLPLTGFIAKSKPYTAADVVASHVPFDEDPWDDELLI